MKKLRFLMLALLIPAFVMTGCDDSGSDNPGDAQIVLPNDDEKTQQAFADDETTGEFTFTAKQSWTATVTENATRANLSGESATRADGVQWLRLLFDGGETYSGAAGEFTLVIELDENYTGETRKATITIQSGNDTITITVTQDGKTETGEIPEPPFNVLSQIPDALFRAYCESQMPHGWDINQDGILSVEEAAAVEFIQFVDFGVTSLEGIEYFTALTHLGCHENQLTSLDLSKNTALTALFCFGNQLTSLDLSKNTALTTLLCDRNQLTSLDVSKNTALTDLICGGNKLTSLDVSKNTALTTLSCQGNPLTSLIVSNTALTTLNCFDYPLLTSLIVSNNTALTRLNCGDNQLTSLIVSNNTALTELYCYNNQLTSLDVSTNPALTNLICHDNQLTSLDVSNTALTDLNCYNNPLTSLDVSNTALTRLTCSDYKLTSLNVSNTALTSLDCGGNQLTSLDLSTNTALTNLYVDDNQLTSLDVSKNTALTDLSCQGNPGNGTSFPLTVWFDESSPVRPYIPFESWEFGNTTIEVEYIYP